MRYKQAKEEVKWSDILDKDASHDFLYKLWNMYIFETVMNFVAMFVYFVEFLICLRMKIGRRNVRKSSSSATRR